MDPTPVGRIEKLYVITQVKRQRNMDFGFRSRHNESERKESSTKRRSKETERELRQGIVRRLPPL
jgi:hypothetical protein